MKYLYTIKCVDGGWGWGETGQVSQMCFETDEELKRHMPGGWIILKKEPTTENFYLRHLIP